MTFYGRVNDEGRKMKVAVLGCGPAGLMAAHAVAQAGVEFDILSDPVQPSKLGGAQYLHHAIPGLTQENPDGYLMVIKHGTEEGYQAKVGRVGQPTSWTKFTTGTLPIWNLGRAYKVLWAMYSGRMKIRKVVPYGEYGVQGLGLEYDVVLSTIPKNAICLSPSTHKFTSMPCWIRTGDLGVARDTMNYSGEYGVQWYRSSHIFGVESKEYAHEAIGGRLIRKPLWNDCDCNPWIFHLGRYGKWERGWLTSDAYTGANEIIRRLHTGQIQAQRP
jgi:hypothetical protein